MIDGINEHLRMGKYVILVFVFISCLFGSCSKKEIETERIDRNEYFDRLKAVEEYYQFLCISKEETLPVDELWFQKMEVFYDDVSYFKKTTNCRFHFKTIECGLPVYINDCDFYKDYTYLVFWYYKNTQLFS